MTTKVKGPLTLFVPSSETVALTGAPLHPAGSMELQQDQGQAADHDHRRYERRPQLQVREEGADQARPRHVQRRAHVQDARVHAQARDRVAKII